MNKFLLLSLVTILACSDPKSSTEQTTNGVGWRDFSGLDNLKMKGVVYYVNNDVRNGFYHGRGIMRVNILDSNINYYNPKKQQRNYYCIIKNQKAEIYDNHVSYINVGDTITIDTKKQVLYWVNNKGVNYEYSISIGEPDFFRFITENKLQKF